MKKIVDRFEFLIFIAAICMISAGILGLYVKIFNMAPPLPAEFVHLPIMGLMAVTMLVRLRETTFGLLSILPYFLLTLLAVASFKWSGQPFLTLRDGITAMLYVMYLATMCWRYSWKQLVEGMWIALFGMVVFSLVLYVAVPNIGRMAETHIGAMSGVWVEKNAAGQAGVFGACLALARMALSPKKFMSSGLSFLAFTLFLILTTSKTSLVAYIVACGGFGWVFMMRRSMPMSALTLVTSLLTGSFLVTWMRSNYGEVLGLLGRSSTFTGRSEIWQAVQFSLADRPWLGHGYSGYWDEIYYGRTLAYVYDELQFMPRHSHNSYIEMKLNLGLVGATLLAASVAFYLVIAIFKVRQSHGAYFAIPFMAAALVIGMFESVLAYPSNFAGAVVVLVAAKMVRPTLHSERQSSFWSIINGFRSEGQGPVKQKARPAMSSSGMSSGAMQGVPAAGPFIDRRRPAERRDRRTPAQPAERRHRKNQLSAETLMWRINNRRRNPFTYN